MITVNAVSGSKVSQKGDWDKAKHPSLRAIRKRCRITRHEFEILEQIAEDWLYVQSIHH
jgi:hypothetical protein